MKSMQNSNFGADSMKVKLEMLNESDFPQIIRWVNQYPENFMIQWAGQTYKYPLTLEQMKEHYRHGINSIESDVFIYRIMNDKKFIGTIQLCRFNFEQKEAVVGRFLIGDEVNRGKGIGRAALDEIVRIGFNDFKLIKIRLNVFDINMQAINCYKSIGFRENQYLEKVYQDRTGEWWNNIEMKLMKEQWLGIRRRH